MLILTLRDIDGAPAAGGAIGDHQFIAGTQDHFARALESRKVLFDGEPGGHLELRSRGPVDYPRLVTDRGSGERRREFKVLRESCGREHASNQEISHVLPPLFST